MHVPLEKRRVRTWAAVLGVLAVTSAGCSRAFKDVATADRAILYSIDGTETGIDYEAKPTPHGFLHGYAILGITELSEADRDGVSESLNRALQDSMADACFLPRHAIRIERGGVQKDYVICFECHQYIVYRNGRRSGGGLLADDPQPLLNEILTRAGVALAPKPFSEAWEAKAEKVQASERSVEAIEAKPRTE